MSFTREQIEKVVKSKGYAWFDDDFKDSIQDELDIFDNICMDIDYN